MPEATSTRSIVLVHGGGHGGWCFAPLARVLRGMGYDVHAPTLTGLGERAHLFRADVDLDCHIEDVTALLHYEDVRDAVLVGHSYGGMVITGATDRAPDRVGHLVYLDAKPPKDGQSLVDVAGPFGGQIGQPDRRRRRDVPVSHRRDDQVLRSDRPPDLAVDARTPYPTSVEMFRAAAAADE